MSFETVIEIDPGIALTQNDYVIHDPIGVFGNSVELNPVIDITDGVYVTLSYAKLMDLSVILSPLIGVGLQYTIGLVDKIYKKASILQIFALRLWDDGDDSRELHFIIDKINVDLRRHQVYPNSYGNPGDLIVFGQEITSARLSRIFKSYKAKII